DLFLLFIPLWCYSPRMRDAIIRICVPARRGDSHDVRTPIHDPRASTPTTTPVSGDLLFSSAFRSPAARTRRRTATLVGTAAIAALLTAGLSPAHASEPTIDHIVSDNPENWTPNVNDGKVESMVQIGNRIIAVGKFTSVTDSNGTSFTRNSIF